MLVTASVFIPASAVRAAIQLNAEFGPASTASPTAWAAMGSLIIVAAIFGLAGYVYISLALQTIARKTKTQNAWLAWIPLVNVILMLDIAKKPLWWIVLFLLPLVNLVITVVVWMAIAKARQKPEWCGILMLIPLVNLMLPGYLAWAD